MRIIEIGYGGRAGMSKNLNSQVLRIVLCILVIYRHTYQGNSQIGNRILWLSIYAVPVFMMMSFYFIAKHFETIEKGYILKRNERLLIPHILYAFLSFLLLYPLGGVTFRGLIMQLLCGKGVNGPLWFIFIMWIITNLFFAISFFFKDKFVYYITALCIVSLILQYSGINYRLFVNTSGEIKGSYGTIIDMIPYAVLGVLIWHYQILKYLRDNRFFNLLVYSIVFVEFYFNRTMLEVKSFGYGGMRIIVASCCIFFFAFLFPLEWLPARIKDTLVIVGKYTFGVYCLHLLVYRWLNYLLLHFEIDVPYGMIFGVLVLCSFIISVVIGKIPNRYIKMLVI